MKYFTDNNFAKEEGMDFLTKMVKIPGLIILFSMISVLSIYSSASPEKKFELNLSGGISHLSGTDTEANSKGRDYLSKISTEAAGGTFSSERDSLDWGWEIAGEIVFNLNSRVALSGGVGYITGKYSSTRMSSLGGVTTRTSGVDQKLKAVPVTVEICYFLPVSINSRLSLVAGAGYYFASFSSSGYRENDTPYWINTDTTGSGGDIGFQGGIGFEYSVSKNIAVVIEGFGRYAKISGFEGTRDQYDSNDWSDSTEGKHYYFEQAASTGEWISLTSFGPEPPSGEDIRNVRDFEIDFSGFTIRAGLKIKLF